MYTSYDLIHKSLKERGVIVDLHQIFIKLHSKMLNNESNPTVSQLSYFDFPFDLDLIIPLLNLCSFRKTEQDNLIKLQRYFHYFGVRAIQLCLSLTFLIILTSLFHILCFPYYKINCFRYFHQSSFI